MSSTRCRSAFVIVALLMMRDVPQRRPVEAGIARRCVVACGARRAALRVPLAADPLDDAARFLRDVLLVGDGAAADLRAGHPARRRHAATAGCSRRRPSASFVTSVALVPLPSASSAAGRHRSGRSSARRRDGRVRHVALVLADVRLPGADRRDRHHQHGDPQHHPAARDAGSAARPDDGINMVFFMGGPQLGELEAGAVANWFGAPFR